MPTTTKEQDMDTSTKVWNTSVWSPTRNVCKTCLVDLRWDEQSDGWIAADPSKAHAARLVHHLAVGWVGTPPRLPQSPKDRIYAHHDLLFLGVLGDEENAKRLAWLKSQRKSK